MKRADYPAPVSAYLECPQGLWLCYKNWRSLSIAFSSANACRAVIVIDKHGTVVLSHLFPQAQKENFSTFHFEGTKLKNKWNIYPSWLAVTNSKTNWIVIWPLPLPPFLLPILFFYFFVIFFYWYFKRTSYALQFHPVFYRNCWIVRDEKQLVC